MYALQAINYLLTYLLRLVTQLLIDTLCNWWGGGWATLHTGGKSTQPILYVK